MPRGIYVRRFNSAKFARMTPKERFEQMVVRKGKNKCWGWLGCLDSDGYGGHRLSYEVHFGPIPKGLCVCHKCDNPSCVNPNHLFLGTRVENRIDCVLKHRQAYGEKHGISLLKEYQVVETLQWIPNSGIPLRKLADKFGVCLGTLERIRSGKSWKHLYHLHSKFNETFITGE